VAAKRETSEWEPIVVSQASPIHHLPEEEEKRVGEPARSGLVDREETKREGKEEADLPIVPHLQFAKSVSNPDTLRRKIKHPKFTLSPGWTSLLQTLTTGKTGNKFLLDWRDQLYQHRKKPLSMFHIVTITNEKVEPWMAHFRGKTGPKVGETLTVLMQIPGTSLVFVTANVGGADQSPSLVHLVHLSETTKHEAGRVTKKAERQFNTLKTVIGTSEFQEARTAFLLDSDVQAVLQSVGDSKEGGKKVTKKNPDAEEWTHVWRPTDEKDWQALEQTIVRRWVDMNRDLSLCRDKEWRSVVISVCCYLFAVTVMVDGESRVQGKPGPVSFL
jgi:hypothetical protein